MEKVILSSKLIIGNGIFSATEISLEEARQWVAENNPKNYCGHATVVLLGLSPANTRGQCDGYSQALCLSAKGRLEFGREYTLEEIEAIGVSFTLISCEESEP